MDEPCTATVRGEQARWWRRTWKQRPAPQAEHREGFILAGERGLQPASVRHYLHHLRRFEAYLGKIGVQGLQALKRWIARCGRLTFRDRGRRKHQFAVALAQAFEQSACLDRWLDPRANLPPAADSPTVSTPNFSQVPIMTLAVYGSQPLDQIDYVTENQIEQAIQAVPGVSSLAVTGAPARRIFAKANPSRLQARSLGLLSLQTAIQGAQLADTPGLDLAQKPFGWFGGPGFTSTQGFIGGMLGFRRLPWRQAECQVQLLSRNARDLEPWFPELTRAGQLLPGNTLVDGEIVICEGQIDVTLEAHASAPRLSPRPSPY